MFVRLLTSWVGIWVACLVPTDNYLVRVSFDPRTTNNPPLAHCARWQLSRDRNDSAV